MSAIDHAALRKALRQATTGNGLGWVRFMETHKTTPPPETFEALRDAAWETLLESWPPPFTITTAAPDYRLVVTRLDFDNAVPRPRPYRAWDLLTFSTKAAELWVCAGCGDREALNLRDILLYPVDPPTSKSNLYPQTQENAQKIVGYDPNRRFAVCGRCQRLKCSVCGRKLSTRLAQPMRARHLNGVGLCEHCAVPTLANVAPVMPDREGRLRLAKHKLGGSA